MIKSFFKTLIILILVVAVCYGIFDIVSTVGIFVDTNKKNETKILISKLTEKLATEIGYLYRINSISKDRSSLEFEVFNVKTIKVDANTNDKIIEGNIISFRSNTIKILKGAYYKVISKKIDRYQWNEKFGHNQVPGPNGFFDDIVKTRKFFQKGSFGPLETEGFFRSVLIQDIKFIPYDGLNRMIKKGTSYESLKEAKNIVIKVTYLNKKRDYTYLDTETVKVFFNNIIRK